MQVTLYVFSVRDMVAETYGQPFYAPTTAAAIRSFSQLSRDPQSQLYASPADFYLYQIGTFDVDTGLLQGLPALVQVAAARDYVQKES